MTQDYYGTKKITAWHQEKDGKEGYAVKYAGGYISWSPKDVFEAAYQPMHELSFGHALEAVKTTGQKIARSGWNGKGMFVVYQKGYPDGITINKNTSEALGIPEGALCQFRPYLMIRNVDGSFAPWVPSIGDVLANDWIALQQPEAQSL